MAISPYCCLSCVKLSGSGQSGHGHSQFCCYVIGHQKVKLQ